ncbi:MAG: hypothetical protein DCC71_16640 [Proteobacteria bacterium]|nr:MAG: hypothetical protein DCC71_16640 [Pseudomonadota bacterium]
MHTSSAPAKGRHRGVGAMRARHLAHLQRRRPRRSPLPGWVIALLALIAISGFAGFGGVAGASIGVAKVAFFVLLACFAACVVHGLARSMHRPVSRL